MCLLCSVINLLWLQRFFYCVFAQYSSWLFSCATAFNYLPLIQLAFDFLLYNSAFIVGFWIIDFAGREYIGWYTFRSLALLYRRSLLLGLSFAQCLSFPVGKEGVNPILQDSCFFKIIIIHGHRLKNEWIYRVLELHQIRFSQVIPAAVFHAKIFQDVKESTVRFEVSSLVYFIHSLVNLFRKVFCHFAK